jgi:hypothetical protein
VRHSRDILDITGITIQEISDPKKGALFEIRVPKWMFRYYPRGLIPLRMVGYLHPDLDNLHNEEK